MHMVGISHPFMILDFFSSSSKANVFLYLYKSLLFESTYLPIRQTFLFLSHLSVCAVAPLALISFFFSLIFLDKISDFATYHTLYVVVRVNKKMSCDFVKFGFGSFRKKNIVFKGDCKIVTKNIISFWEN